MDFTYLFTSLQGRINRGKWWAGEAILFLIFSITALIGNQTMIGQTISALIWIILYLPAYPLAAKRFQDRDKLGETALYGYIPSIIAVGLLSFGPVEGNPQTLELPVSGVDVSLNWNTNTLGLICFFILIGITVWFLIELGMLKGTPGPNRFGPDPLVRTDAKLQPAGRACVDLELGKRRWRFYQFPRRSPCPRFLQQVKFRAAAPPARRVGRKDPVQRSAFIWASSSLSPSFYGLNTMK